MMSMILSVLVGSGVGATLGYFGKCSTGACPLTANPWRGALVGAALGLVLYLGAGCKSGNSEPTPNLKAVSESEFESEVVKSSLPVVVDFYATWCGPCKVLSPRLNELAGPLASKVAFVKVDIDHSREVAQRFQVEAVPTLLFFRGGAVVDRIIGVLPAEALKKRLETFAQAPARRGE